MSRTARVLGALVVLATLGQAVSLVARGSRGLSDFGVFYRTCQLLEAGTGSELYPRLDAVTTWPVSLSPTGLAIFQPLCLLPPVGASAVWAVFNLILLAVSLAGLRQLLAASNDPHTENLFAWAAILFMVLSWGSIQVGQFSVLFVACWIWSLGSLAAGHRLWSGVSVAIPAAIKLYPIMMLAVPLSLVRSFREGLHHIALMTASLVVMCLLVPALMYGERGWALNVSFWQNVILSRAGQVQYMQTVRHGNQSLDTLLLRYLSYDPDFHDVFVWVPYVAFDKGNVLTVANALRVLIALAALRAVWRWRRSAPRTFSVQNLLTMAALWSSTLYLLLPETKARYAIYAFLGFIPLLQHSLGTDRDVPEIDRTRQTALIVVCLILILVLLPAWVQAYGVGFFGPLLLWLENLKLTAEARDRAQERNVAFGLRRTR